MERDFIKNIKVEGSQLKKSNAEERRLATEALVADNYFCVPNSNATEYDLIISQTGEKILFNIIGHGEINLQIKLPSRKFKRLIKDYFLIFDNHNNALESNFSPEKIETIDMGRRAIHNEAAELLLSELEGKVITDFKTARKLFTVLTSL